MTVEFINNNCFSETKDILIKDGKKTLKIFYASNGDLYIDIFGQHSLDEYGNYTATFSINQRQEIYRYFEILLDNIIKCNVFQVSDIELEMCNTQEQTTKLLNSSQLYNERLKSSYAYNSLVQDSTIIWYSDNIYDEKANKVSIEKIDDEIILTFIDNPDDPTFGFGIRICNSGSKYDPFNICFMNLFNQLQQLNKRDKQSPTTLIFGDNENLLHQEQSGPRSVKKLTLPKQCKK